MLLLTDIEGSDGSDFTVLGTRLPSSVISFPFVQAKSEKARLTIGISLFFWLIMFLRFLQIWACERPRIAPFCKVAPACLKLFMCFALLLTINRLSQVNLDLGQVFAWRQRRDFFKISVKG